MSWIANICYLFAAIFYLPILFYQMVFQRKNRRGWWQRFGYVPRRTEDNPCIWIHAVSLGEVNAARTLVEQLKLLLGDVEIVISATTDTGYARAKELYPKHRVFRYPLDFSWVVRRVLKRIRPTLIMLVELEVWYNLVIIARKQGVKVCVVNGRFTERSCRRFGWIDPLIRPMFLSLSWVGAQTAEIAERFRIRGVPKSAIEVAGSLKWDTVQTINQICGVQELAQALGIKRNRRTVVLGSSGPGEEKILLDILDQLPLELRGEVQLVIVPRKPERFSEVAKLIEQRGYYCVRRSEQPDGSLSVSNTSGRVVWLGDTVGELRKFYCLADVVVIGRSLVPMGGSDPMEAAALGKPILVGPHMENFSDPVRQLLQADALHVVADSTQLAQRVQELLLDKPLRETMGQRGGTVVRENQGATSRILRQITELLRST